MEYFPSSQVEKYGAFSFILQKEPSQIFSTFFFQFLGDFGIISRLQASNPKHALPGGFLETTFLKAYL